MVVARLHKLSDGSYEYKDDLEDGACLVSSPVGVTEEGAKEGEDVHSACPLADIVCCISVVLLQDSRQEQDQVHANPEECQRR